MTGNGNTLTPALQGKYEQLRTAFVKIGPAVVAYSGGVDSTLVAKVAFDVLGPANTFAVLAVSPSLGRDEEQSAVTLLEKIGVPYQVIRTNEVEDPDYAANPINRCYFCKAHVYGAIVKVAEDREFKTVVDGFNLDDTGDLRPGRRAGRELNVRSPLFEVGLNKADVRVLAHYVGLPNWNKPAMACLSSRVEYGMAITPRILSQVDEAERALRRIGFENLRVRHHDKLARVEVEENMIAYALERREEIIAAVKAAGYVYVTLDLQGLRRGSMNEVLISGE